LIDPIGLQGSRWNLINASKALHGSKPKPAHPLTAQEKEMLNKAVRSVVDQAAQITAEKLTERYISKTAAAVLRKTNFFLLIFDPFPPPAGGPEDMVPIPLKLPDISSPPDLSLKKNLKCE
jgi:hypothetical protein